MTVYWLHATQLEMVKMPEPVGLLFYRKNASSFSVVWFDELMLVEHVIFLLLKSGQINCHLMLKYYTCLDENYWHVSTYLRLYFSLCIYCIQMGQWHAADEYDGQVREITFRTLCNSPMCPPDTAMTEWQHVVLSPDKKKLVQLLSSC